MRIVIALGGNALSSPDGRARVEDQQAAVTEAAEPIADLVVAGHEVVLTHGNGPQVGNLLVKNELAAHAVAPIPLDWCVAQTQATIGFTLMNVLDGALARRGSSRRTATLVSRTLVAEEDPGFLNPTKPIGRYLSGDEAAVLESHGQQFVESPGKGWRRVVPSPVPRGCVDAPAADALLAAGFVVVCSGGGGVPVVGEPDRSWRGVEAVVDKDLTAALVAEHLEADVLVIATDVPHVVTGWGSGAESRSARSPRPGCARSPSDERFPAGSMGPKVAAVCDFVERGGGTGVITSLHALGDAVAGRSGTRVVPGPTWAAAFWSLPASRARILVTPRTVRDPNSCRYCPERRDPAGSDQKPASGEAELATQRVVVLAQQRRREVLGAAARRTAGRRAAAPSPGSCTAPCTGCSTSISSPCDRVCSQR